MEKVYIPENWENYLIIEQDLIRTFRYVSFDRNHFNVYSEEYARIILVSCVAIENTIQHMASIIDPNNSFNGLQSYYQCIISKYPKFTTIEMLLPQYDYRVNPWSSWSSSSCPEWWTYGYNKIKHNRIQHQTAPSLERAIGAVAGLQAILLYSYRLRYTDFSIPSSFDSKLIHEVNIGEDYDGDVITKQWILPDDK